MTLLSGPDRPLRFRMRADLEVHRHKYQGRDYWVLKDPLAQKYYRFEQEEYWLLEQLGGQASLAALKQRFEKQFAPQKLAQRELHQLITLLHRSSLLVADHPGQGEELLARQRQRRRRARLAAFTNVLCIRFKGCDPDRLLGRLDRHLGWLFSAPCLGAAAVFFAAALLLLATHFATFQSRLPEFHQFFAAGNWLWLAATLGATKVLHEFGHGLSCKRFGGECHEMGVMLLVLTPCLYCNVTDSWTIPSKWKRAAIGAAGMYVELMLAAAATFGWWFSQPGVLNYLCLNIMFVCSVSTLLFNANPLMRYDGYYILSDLLEIPNLRQKSTAILHRKLGTWLLGLKATADPFLPQQNQLCFAAYAVLAFFYRWIVVGGILWFLYQVFEPYGFQVVGQAMVAVVLYGLIVQPIVQAIRFFQVPGRYEQVSHVRSAVSLAGLGIVLAALCWIPTPHFIRCDVYLQPGDSEAAYVETDGILAEIHVSPGDWVTAGQPVVTLENLDLQLAVVRLSAQQQQLESRLAGLRQRAFSDETAVAEIAEMSETLAGVGQQLENRQAQLAKMRVLASRDGFVLPVPEVPPAPGGAELPPWAGSPLDAKNLNGFLQAGELICRVGDPRRVEAVLAIDEGDVEFVRTGQPVEIVLDAFPHHRQPARLTGIAQLEMQVTPASLSSKSGGNLATRTDQQGREIPVGAVYQGSAHLDDVAGRLFNGATGQARIRVGHQTIAQRAWRLVCQTFNFDV